MRRSLWAVSFVALCVAPAARAQSAPDGSIVLATPTVNQRLTTPTNQADTYMGVSLGQLIMALGFTLKGVSYGRADIQMMTQHETAAVPAAALGSAADRPAAAPAAPGRVPSP